MFLWLQVKVMDDSRLRFLELRGKDIIHKMFA